ncbi:MAG: ankyrin repeat domain-containing protein [Pseudomonadota bacterium]|nr:ankyrin repeat domain-containing protein [Pseudomonadota bacterium]
MKTYHCISVDDAEDLILSSHLLILDMRDYRSYVTGHHPKALHLTDSNLRSLLKHTAKHVPILIYCYHGHSSQDMARLFGDFGFEEVYSLDGGWEAWFQTITPPTAPLSDSLTGWLQSHQYDVDNLDAKGVNHHTALMSAAMESNLEICEELLNKGASVHLLNKDGNNALWFACVVGNPHLIQLLIHHGADINNQNDNGATVLMFAASKGNVEIVKLLVSLGAKQDLVTLDDFSALDVCGDRETLKILRAAPHVINRVAVC